MTHTGWEDRPIEGLRELRDVTPPPSLVAGVMTRISVPRRRSFWSWLVRPRRLELRLSPLGVASFGLGVTALALLLATGSGRPGGRALQLTATAPAVGDTPAPVMVRFVIEARGAQKVTVAGDFNDWDPASIPLEGPDAAGNFVATVPVPRGEHEYMFVVDGTWVTDPSAPERRPDGYGRENALLRL